jgi:phage baseplate assembly protein gpV
MNDFFDYILKQPETSEDILGLQYGIVATSEDPLGLGRIQVYDQAKGGQYKSDWLFRALPFTSFTPPVPTKDDLVVFGYINGDPHQGCYVGVVVNNNNKPVGASKDFTIVLGGAKVVIEGATGRVKVETSADVSIVSSGGNVKVEGTNVTIKGANLTLEGTTEVTLKAPSVKFQATAIDFGSPSTLGTSGKQVATLGAIDSDGDTLVSKGW